MQEPLNSRDLLAERLHVAAAQTRERFAVLKRDVPEADLRVVLEAFETQAPVRSLWFLDGRRPTGELIYYDAHEDHRDLPEVWAVFSSKLTDAFGKYFGSEASLEYLADSELVLRRNLRATRANAARTIALYEGRYRTGRADLRYGVFIQPTCLPSVKTI